MLQTHKTNDTSQDLEVNDLSPAEVNDLSPAEVSSAKHILSPAESKNKNMFLKISLFKPSDFETTQNNIELIVYRVDLEQPVRYGR